MCKGSARQERHSHRFITVRHRVDRYLFHGNFEVFRQIVVVHTISRSTLYYYFPRCTISATRHSNFYIDRAMITREYHRSTIFFKGHMANHTKGSPVHVSGNYILIVFVRVRRVMNEYLSRFYTLDRGRDLRRVSRLNGVHRLCTIYVLVRGVRDRAYSRHVPSYILLMRRTQIHT